MWVQLPRETQTFWWAGKNQKLNSRKCDVSLWTNKDANKPPQRYRILRRWCMGRPLIRGLKNVRVHWPIGKYGKIIGHRHNLHLMIKSTRPRTPGVTEVITVSAGSLIHFQKRYSGHWVEFYKEQLRWPNATVDFPLSCGEIMQMDTRPPSEMQIIKKTDFLQRNEATRPDGLAVASAFRIK